MAAIPPSITATVSTDRESVAQGATVRITVTVKNTGAAAQTLSFTSGCLTDYEIVDAAGTVSATSERMCSQVLTSRTLAAGEAFSDVHVLVRGMAGMPAPGTYTLRGVVLLADGALRSPTIPIAFP